MPGSTQRKKLHQAIILAGGKGERLRPVTNDRPKPMVEIGGKPILSYQIQQLKEAGVDEVVFAVSYQREVLQNHVGEGDSYGIKARYSIEESPLGRGGGIRKAMNELSEWDDVLVLNGDNLWKIDLKDLIKMHQDNDVLVTLTVVPLKSPYGIVSINDKNQVEGFLEKPTLPHWVNAGVYVFSKELHLRLPEVGDHETELFPMLDKQKFLAFESTDYWRGVDTVKDLTEATKEIQQIFS